MENNFVFGSGSGESMSSQSGCIVIGDGLQLESLADNQLLISTGVGVLSASLTDVESELVRGILSRADFIAKTI